MYWNRKDCGHWRNSLMAEGESALGYVMLKSRSGCKRFSVAEFSLFVRADPFQSSSLSWSSTVVWFRGRDSIVSLAAEAANVLARNMLETTPLEFRKKGSRCCKTKPDVLVIFWAQIRANMVTTKVSKINEFCRNLHCRRRDEDEKDRNNSGLMRSQNAFVYITNWIQIDQRYSISFRKVESWRRFTMHANLQKMRSCNSFFYFWWEKSFVSEFRWCEKDTSNNATRWQSQRGKWVSFLYGLIVGRKRTIHRRSEFLSFGNRRGLDTNKSLLT